MINVRQKGQDGEREVCDWLNGILQTVLSHLNMPLPSKPVFQRNQNQTAVGGSDISNPFRLCIEVKRQEIIDINAWWKQCLQASKDFGGTPIILYRQNGKRKWHAVLSGSYHLYSENSPTITYRSEISHEDFEVFIWLWMEGMITSGLWKP